jgi:hypothetical protein
MKLLLRILLTPLDYLYDIPSRFVNWVKIRILGYEGKIKIHGKITDGSRVAILAIFPGTSSWESVNRIILTCVESGYEVVCVINKNKESSQWINQISDLGLVVIERENLGADFGAFKTAIIQIMKNGYWSKLENLLLINDSIYITPKSKLVVAEIVSGSNDENCLFLHRQSIPHAGSMLMRFDHRILHETKFQDFWREYYPYSNKKKIITKGEHRLSQVVGIDYFCPYVNPDKLLNGKDLELSSAEILQVLSWTYRSSKNANEYVKNALSLSEHRRIIEFAIFNLQVSNSLGLFLSHYLGAPIKLDLVKSGHILPSDFLKILESQECEAHEIKWARDQIAKNGSYYSANLINRIRIA